MKIREIYIQWKKRINPPVFFGAAGLTLGIIIFGGVWTETAGTVFNAILSFITYYFGWYYIVIMSFFLAFVIWLYFSPYGKIRLGSDDSSPEFSFFSWFAMLFAAGMGMGLIFWGVAEPVKHFMAPPIAEPETVSAMRESLRISFYHWGFHPWAVYIIFGLGISYFHYRQGLPLAPRSLLFPILGKKIHGNIGHLADAFCTVGTLLGVATSLGLGAMQINSGLSKLIDISYSINTQITIIIIITLIATTSTVSGVSRGIKLLSIVNIYAMFLLLFFVFFAGPTLFLVKMFITTFGDYVQNIIKTSLWMYVGSNSDWQADWTLFYWGWWISWCPFVGIFIARISKGRTIREFVFFVFLIPSVVNFLWFSFLGGTALHIEYFDKGGIGAIVQENVAMSLHALLRHLPLSAITQWVGLLLAVIFFITSSDSGSLVDDMVTSGGHPNPPVVNRVFWGFSEGAAAAVLLLAGGLKALQMASVSSGLPQSILLIAACYSLVKALRLEVKKEKYSSQQ